MRSRRRDDALSTLSCHFLGGGRDRRGRPGSAPHIQTLASPNRDQGAAVAEAGVLPQISYNQVEQLYIQNPQFGFSFIGLMTQRLFQNIARLESGLARCPLDKPSPPEHPR